MPPAVSVCMATFNGQQFVRAQVESILAQLDETDELVVVDDGSTDGTIAVLLSMRDPRIRIHPQLNSGPVRAFERAIRLARGSVVMLADQDDIWPPGRVRSLLAALGKAHLAAGSLSTIGDESGTLIRFQTTAPRPIRALTGLLIGTAPYYGSAMAFDRDVLAISLPFPRWIEAHDHWLAICGLALGSPTHLDDVVTLRRLHSRNLSTRHRRRLVPILKTRVGMLRMAISAQRRFIRWVIFGRPGPQMLSDEQ